MSSASWFVTKSVDEPKRLSFRMPGLSERVVIALGLGLITGIHFCVLIRAWQPVGDIFTASRVMVVYDQRITFDSQQKPPI